MENKSMTGKEKCEFLKDIRKNIAEKNGIPYEPRDCNHEVCSIGTCPLCEKEAAELLAELKKKEKNGEKIQIDTEAVEAIETISEKKYEDKRLIEEEEERERIKRHGIPKSIKRHGLWDKIKGFIHKEKIMGGYDEDEYEIDEVNKEETALMGIINPDLCFHEEPEPEHEPDIIWNMDKEDPVISSSANIKNDKE